MSGFQVAVQNLMIPFTFICGDRGEEAFLESLT